MDVRSRGLNEFPNELLLNYWQQSLGRIGQNPSLEGAGEFKEGEDSTLTNENLAENPVLLTRLYTPNPRLVSGGLLVSPNQPDSLPSRAKRVLEEAPDAPDFICKKTSYELVQEANCMELGEERTGLLEAAFKDVLRDFIGSNDFTISSVIDEAVQIANCMEGVRKQECLEIVFKKALDSDAHTYEFLPNIAEDMLGERKENFLNEVFEEALEQGCYWDTFHIADLMEEDNKQASLERAANAAYEAGEYKGCAYVAEGLGDRDMRGSLLQRALEGARGEGDFPTIYFIQSML